ncbi:MAG: autotransporter outer membrane beta-barrel domain-containing protein, partial [Deltaproteobacteria bacterium]|nr:autotransporter outer membrane beta-barrel domain-containing protein [Deltaproteobacteria bacterium]
ADAISNRAIPSASASALGAAGFGAFSAMGYGTSRIESGSHIDVKGFSGNIGLAAAAETSSGIATAGVFLEFGRGEFDSYNDFAGLPTVHGSGDVTYIGGGLLGRFEIGSAGSSRPYVEGSVRLGTTRSDFTSDDFLGILADRASFELHSGYYGFHVGAGYILNLAGLGDDGSLDLSAKVFHTRRDGDEFAVLGARASTSAVSSTRLVAGARLSFGLSELVKPFVGGYFEHEFQGESQVIVDGFELPKASLEGNSGIGELGVTLTPPSVPLEVELGLQGTGGKRQGVSGGLKVNFTF